jgi:hypothetical protein
VLLPVLTVLSMVHLEGDVTAAGGDYVDVPFTVPAGTVEIQVVHTDNSDNDILDFGVYGPEGFRGWGGGGEEDAVIGVAESSRSYLPGPITPGAWTVSIGKAKLDADGAHYTIDVICRDNATLPVRARAPYTAVELSTERHWYKGDFHVHSHESDDSTATLDQISTLARQRGLDFVNISDHNTSSHLALLAEAQKSLSNFLFLRGAEVTTYSGHGNAVGLDHYVDHRIGHLGRTIEATIGEVRAAGALFLVNHPTLDLGENCLGCPWEHATTPWEMVNGIEIITGRWDVVERLFVPSAIKKWDELLDAGYRITAVSGSDDHRAGMGTGITDTALGSPCTLVLADGLSEAAIMRGVAEGRTIVQLRGPDDPFVEMHIGDAEIGDTISAGTAKVAATVTGGQGYFLQLWRDGKKLEQIEVTSNDFSHTFSDEPGAGQHRRYRLELINDSNNRVVVTSHIYVDGTDAGGGCCQSGRGAPNLALIAIVALWLHRRRSRPSSRRWRATRSSPRSS